MMDEALVSASKQESPPMFFALTELEHHPILFDLSYAPGEIDFGEGLRQQGPLWTSGQAELPHNTLGEIRTRGTVQVEFECSCDRCLEPAPQHIDTACDLFFRPLPKLDNPAEVRLEERSEELSLYEGDGV